RTFAKKLGILAGMDQFAASPRMNQYEKGVHSPDFQTVRALAKVLEVPTAFFYCEEDALVDLILHFKK
ncbi:helix-turn-helix domain-containing protein, partial [Pseudoalteromonas sp. BSi20495]|uniref:helix-turn-helix domain-containing protein n=1 Tax=Pseudoalteromonas sp. BSi20495 TaxID=386429 RepID=UPI0005182419